MKTASFPLCKELYSLTKWERTRKYWNKNGELIQTMHRRPDQEYTPAYDSPYLDNKLYGIFFSSFMDTETRELVRAALFLGEDKACQTAINLIKEGKLKV